jgi:hypothetical protein
LKKESLLQFAGGGNIGSGRGAKPEVPSIITWANKEKIKVISTLLTRN